MYHQVFLLHEAEPFLRS